MSVKIGEVQTKVSADVKKTDEVDVDSQGKLFG